MTTQRTVVRHEDGSNARPDPSLTAVQNDDINTNGPEDLGLTMVGDAL